MGLLQKLAAGFGVCALVLLGVLSMQPASAQNAELWSERNPNAGPNTIVHIRAGEVVLIDEDFEIGGLVIEGELRALDDSDLDIRTEYALVLNGGEFNVGSQAAPFENDFTLTLTGDNPTGTTNLQDQIGRSLANQDAFLMAMGEGSEINLFGEDRNKRSHTQITSTVQAGSRTLNVEHNTGWEVGDQIAITSTSSDFDEAEALTITAINGRNITVQETLQNRHYGEIERYDNGSRTWDFDMRAEVGLLSRNVTITGDENADVDEIGGHMMIQQGASLRMVGTELTRMGQFGQLGRYPVHFHLLGDTSGQFIRNNSIHHTFNKGITIHGTNDIEINNNVVFDHIGHGIFLEDGNEIRTEITDNLVFVTRGAPQGASVPSDISHPSSYWIEHPNNTLTGNTGAGAEFAAFWVFGETPPHGESAGQPTAPGNFSDLVFNNNTGHSSKQAFFFEGRVRDDGTVQLGDIIPANHNLVTISDLTAYQIRNPNQGAVWVRSRNFVVQNVMVADATEGVFLQQDSYLQDGLFVAESQGNSESWQDGLRQKGVRLYHPEASVVSDVHFVGFNEVNDHANGPDIGSDVAFSIRASSTHRLSSHSRGLTFEDTPVDRMFWWNRLSSRDPFNSVVRNSISVLLDHDGSLTGTAGLAIAHREVNIPGAQDFGLWNSESFRPAEGTPTWNEVLAETFTSSEKPTDLR